MNTKTRYDLTRQSLGEKFMNVMSTIDVDKNGNSTVYGEYAHRLWDYCNGSYPRKACGKNRFFVLEIAEMPYGTRWDMKASQETKEGALRYMDIPGRVLISIEEEL